MTRFPASASLPGSAAHGHTPSGWGRPRGPAWLRPQRPPAELGCLQEFKDFAEAAPGTWLVHCCQTALPGVAGLQERPTDPGRSRAAASQRAYAAVFCPVTDAWKMKSVTSSARPTNGRSSRGQTFLPFPLGLLMRVSEHARAEGVGEISSRVARMSSEAPPPRLYIKGWRRARRRHFVLEWSSL